MLLNLGLMRCGTKPKTFGTVRNTIPTTIETPNLVTSRRCYFSVATGTAFVLPAGASVRFNDSGAWIAVSGNTPAGAKFWRCRFESSAGMAISLTKTLTLGGVNYPFTIVTKIFYSGMTVYGDVRTYAVPVPDYYVDSRVASSGDGLTSLTPFKTIAELPTIENGDIIGLAAGSYWREEIDLGYTLAGVQIVAYGSDMRPHLDAADVATGWALVGGTSHTYSLSWTHYVYEGSFLSVWENGERLTYVATSELVESTPGSFTVPNPCPSPSIIKIHPTGSGDPATNGSHYEISKRNYGIYAGDSNTIKFVATSRNGHNDGSLVTGKRSTIVGCIGADGTKHNVLTGGGTVTDTIAWKNDQSDRTNQTLFVAYTPYGNGSSTVYDGCLAKASNFRQGIDGFYSHTGDNSSKHDLVSWSNSATSLCYGGFSGVAIEIDADNLYIEKAYVGIAAYGVELFNCSGCYIKSSSSYSIYRGITIDSSSSEAYIDNTIVESYDLNSGAIYASASVLNVSNCVFHLIPGGTGATAAIWHYSAGRMTVDGCIFSGLDAGNYSLNADSVVASDNNCFYPATIDIVASNVGYTSVAAYQAATGLDANSITDDPMFVDPGSDYRLQLGSPATGMGLTDTGTGHLQVLSDAILATMITWPYYTLTEGFDNYTDEENYTEVENYVD